AFATEIISAPSRPRPSVRAAPAWMSHVGWGTGGMNVAFLTRLARIVADAAPDAARTADAIALVDAYRQSLYGRIGIDASCRPTMWAKEQAKDALDDLRLKVLRAELGAPAGAACIYRVARERIEMARRALDLRLVDDGV